MAGGGPVTEARASNPRGERAYVQPCGVEVFVGVQVDGQPQLAGELEAERLHRHRVGGQVRDAADHVGPGGHRFAQQGPVGPRREQRDDLQVEHVGEPCAHLGQRGDAHDLHVVGHVDMGTDRRTTVGKESSGGPLGAFDDVVEGELWAVGRPRLDRPLQVARGVRHAVGAERLVEVGVGLGRRREQQPPAEVGDGVARLGAERRGALSTTCLDRGDDAVGAAHVDETPVGEARRPQDQTGHSWPQDEPVIGGAGRAAGGAPPSRRGAGRSPRR